MKKCLALTLLLTFSPFSFAQGTYESVMGSGVVDDSEMIEAQEEEQEFYEGEPTNSEVLQEESNVNPGYEKQDQMEERNQNSSTIIEADESVNYTE